MTWDVSPVSAEIIGGRAKEEYLPFKHLGEGREKVNRPDRIRQLSRNYYRVNKNQNLIYRLWVSGAKLFNLT